MSTPETDAIRSALAAKELDEMLSVFSSGPEDCWTDPAKRAMRYIADLRAQNGLALRLAYAVIDDWSRVIESSHGEPPYLNLARDITKNTKPEPHQS